MRQRPGSATSSLRRPKRRTRKSTGWFGLALRCWGSDCLWCATGTGSGRASSSRRPERSPRRHSRICSTALSLRARRRRFSSASVLALISSIRSLCSAVRFLSASDLIGLLVGVVLSHRRPLGNLRVDRSDPTSEPYLFLELDTDVRTIMRKRRCWFVR
mgnify:CR=1 FL=1